MAIALALSVFANLILAAVAFRNWDRKCTESDMRTFHSDVSFHRKQRMRLAAIALSDTTDQAFIELALKIGDRPKKAD